MLGRISSARSTRTCLFKMALLILAAAPSSASAAPAIEFDMGVQRFVG